MKRIGTLLAMLLAAGLAACLDGGGSSSPQPASLVLRKGIIRTMNAHRTVAESVAIRGDTIVAVGADTDIARYIGTNTQVVDLQGATVLPGFIDAHVHPEGGAERLSQCSVDGTQLSVADLIAYVQTNCLANEVNPAPDKWIQVANVNPVDFMATHTDLDQLSSTRPVALHGIDGHTEWVNTVALKLANITAATPDPAGGQIARDANGNPTGFLKDAAQGLVDGIIPALALADRITLTQRALDMLRSKGITTVQDAWAGDSALEVYEAMEKSGQLNMRVRATIKSAIVDSDAEYARLEGIRSHFQGHPLVRADAVKIFSDGVIEYPTQTAAMIHPYLDGNGNATGNYGGRYFDQDTLNRYVAHLDKAGFTVHVHSIGDFTTHAVLDAFAYARAQNGVLDNRHEIAHLQAVDPADFPRFAQLGVYANMQLFWAEQDIWSMDAVAPYISATSHRYMYPAASLKAAGATIIGGSDWPVDAQPGDPMPNTPLSATQLGVTRTNPWSNDPYFGKTLHAEEDLAVDDMIAAYTIHAAEALKQDSSTGSIDVGKLADLVVLGQDPYTVPASTIMTIPVKQTLLGGAVVYQAGASAQTQAKAMLAKLAQHKPAQVIFRNHAACATGRDAMGWRQFAGLSTNLQQNLIKLLLSRNLAQRKAQADATKAGTATAHDTPSP